MARSKIPVRSTLTSAPHFNKYDFGSRRDGEAPETVAAYLTGHMIAATLPGLDVSETPRRVRGGYGWTDRKLIEATEGNAPARTLLTDLLRESAELIRAGEMSPVLPRYDRPEPDFRPSVPETQIFVLKPFRYGTGEGRMPAIVTNVVENVPAPAAERAIAEGFASETAPRNLEDIRARRPAATNGVNVFDLPDLGFDLAEWTEQEIARRRAEWLVEQERQAA